MFTFLVLELRARGHLEKPSASKYLLSDHVHMWTKVYREVSTV